MLIDEPVIPFDQVSVALHPLAVNIMVSPLQMAFLLAETVGALPPLPIVMVSGLDAMLVQVLDLQIAV